jgi:hypothetical protein
VNDNVTVPDGCLVINQLSRRSAALHKHNRCRRHARDERVEKLVAVFGGQKGGPMAGFAPLIGEMLGVDRMRGMDEGPGTHLGTLGWSPASGSE